MEATYQPQQKPMRFAAPFRAAARIDAPIYVAVFLFYLLLLPEQFNPRIGGVLLPPYRLFLLPAVLVIVAGWISGKFRFGLVDLLVVLATLWIWLASYMSSGSFETGSIQFGSYFVDITLAYLVMRVAIRTPQDLRVFLVLVAPAVIFHGILVIQEALTHIRIYQRIASDLTGSPYRLRDDTRMGLMRGAGAFPHPILAGIFLASFLPLYGLSGLRGWPRILGILASIGAVFSMSSAALLGVIAGGALWAYDWLSERIANFKWRVLLFLTSISYVSIELTSNTGFFGLLVRYASLNTSTSYNRVLIWRYGTQNVAEHPWFGIGYDDWDRPSWMYSGSFDHFWLLLALRFGIPTSVLFALATIAAVLLVVLKSNKLNPVDRRLYRGVAISLAVFGLGVISVSIWLAPLVWFSMLLGIAVSLGSVRQAAPVVAPPAPAPRREQPPGLAGAMPHPRAVTR